MNVLNCDELQAGKAYLMHEPNNGKTVTCETSLEYGYVHVHPFGFRDAHRAGHFSDYVFMEIEVPSRSDWALAIVRKDAE